MENDLNNDQAVTDPNQDLNSADAVNQQSLTDDQVAHDQNQDNILADGTDANKPIPYAKFQEANEKAKKAEEDRAYAQRQLELMQMQQVQQAAPVQQAIAKTVEEQVLQEMGIEAEDLFGANIVDFQQRVSQKNNQTMQQNTAAMANQQFIQTHPDVSEVVGTINPMTRQPVYSAELLAVLQEKPYLAGACNSVEGAYNVVMQERELKKLTKTNQITTEHQNRQGVDIQTAPLGSSAAGGGSNGSAQGQGMLSREQSAQIERDIKDGKYS